MKINVDLTNKVTDLAGKPVNETTLGELLAEILLNGNEGPPLKLLKISTELADHGKVDLAVDDYNLIVGLIEKNQRLTNLGKARILEAMEASRIKAIPEPK
jgi:hypothetical protein